MAIWKIDPDHSVAAFYVRHMMISNVRGQFNTISGLVNFDPEDIATSSVEVEIGTAGIWTGIQKRDEHLRSADFLDVLNHPNMFFKSTRVEPIGGRNFTVYGDLTIRGITHGVLFETEYSGPVKDPFEAGTSCGFKVVTKINREDFGMTWNVTMEGGGIVVGKQVMIMLDLEADLA